MLAIVLNFNPDLSNRRTLIPDLTANQSWASLVEHQFSVASGDQAVFLAAVFDDEFRMSVGDLGELYFRTVVVLGIGRMGPCVAWRIWRFFCGHGNVAGTGESLRI